MQATQIVERFTDVVAVESAAVERAFAQNKGVVFQFAKNYPQRELIDQIEALAKEHPGRIDLRFYGFYSDTFDCEKIGPLKHIKRLSVDCLTRAKNFEALGQYTLEYISVNSHEGMPSNIASVINGSQLKTLFIGEGKTKLDLAPLAAMEKLERLSISAASKGIEAIAALKHLGWLQLLGVKKVGYSFVQKLPSLQSLILRLGGRENLDDIENAALRHLQVTRIQGLKDVSVLQRLPQLEWLLIEDQLQLKDMVLASKGSKLKQMLVINCKNLTQLTNLNATRDLNHLRLIRTGLDFDSILPQLPPALKIYAFYTGKKKVDDALEKRIAELGYKILSH